jgi:hypothetical protein
MVQVNTSYTDFSAGEISPRFYGRFDAQAFYKSARRLVNFIPETAGAARYRSGTIFANKTRFNQKAYLYAFSFTDAASFVLEFTPNKVRFFSNNGLVTATAQSITGITNANPAVVTYSGLDNLSNGDTVLLQGIGGMTELNGVEAVVANVDTVANTFELS